MAGAAAADDPTAALRQALAALVPTVPSLVARVVELPDRGRLIVGTDLQGNVADFERLEEAFREANEEHPDGATLVITGDMVHGPECKISGF